MPEKQASTSTNISLPGFKETFSHVLQQFPVESQWRTPNPPLLKSNSRDVDAHSTMHMPYGPTCSPSSSVSHTPEHISASQSRNLGAYQLPVDSSLSQADSRAYPQATPCSSVTPDRASQREDPETETQRVRKKHICSICDKDFLRPSSLETHMNSHTGAKPHKCTFPGCEKHFSAKSNMKRHLRKHLSPNDGYNDDYESG